jgi:hypothetical protein
MSGRNIGNHRPGGGDYSNAIAVGTLDPERRDFVEQNLASGCIRTTYSDLL